ncbi:hypothetical protein HNR00_002541 [Methylorubrum rhodinum]|uniref:DNA mimic protein DMP19 C-terminal domain-containing protein n=1 Tax=Methylorubrum rhodinum TaxID=29428 RepID=A0A840ZL66_9HYPH|nr:DMP19 family protein [Methylorubrum rhodinum]MBB5757825.1 hypothetical protein [Methylorubrum rhodinum]
MYPPDITERNAWPGPCFSESGGKNEACNEENYVFAAIGSVASGWEFEEPEWRRVNQPRLNEDQIGLFAIWNVAGQIENGGITQVFYNSFGELAEDALQGARRFGLNRLADILEEAYDRFARPVPIDREERWRLLEKMAGMQPHDSEDMEAVSEIFKKCSKVFDDLDDRYFDLLNESGESILITLARIIEARKGSFFKE